MADITSEFAGVFTGLKAFGFQTIGLVAWLIGVILLCIIAGVITWLVVRRKKYNLKIVVFEKVGGNYQPTRKDVAREVRYGEDGTTIFYLRKHKKVLPRGTIQVGPRTYWYKIRDDGEWENVDAESLSDRKGDEKPNRLHRDMRLARTSIQRGHREQFEKKQSWLAANWTIIAGVGFIAMVGIMTFLLFDKWIDLAAAVSSSVENAGDVLVKAEQVVARLDVVCQGGPGYAPAS